jgi:DMSO/TMAO reductase YedYZ molybdopterin-dependent catalytic subunit
VSKGVYCRTGRCQAAGTSGLLRSVVLLAVLLTAAASESLPSRGQMPAQTPAPSTQLTVAGDVTTPLTLTIADLKKMPRNTVAVMNPHEKKMETYEGVLLEDLLHRAGAMQGDQLRGLALSMYVVAEAADGYRVVFSLAELDSEFSESDVLVADTRDEAPLDATVGPLRLVAPHDKRPARWVRMLKSIKVVRSLPQ